MSPWEPSSRTGPAWARALLIAVLLFGFAAMHTLGHLQHDGHAPSGSPAIQLGQPVPAPHAVPLYAETDDGRPSALPHVAEVAGTPWDHGDGAPSGSAHAAMAASASAPDLPELDPTSVCLTLGSFAVVLLGVAAIAFARWPGPPADPSTPLRRAPLPPVPTPDQPSLARLQVLRV
ncbi:hypothetical protein [Nocardiopsis sp. NPDC006938]|uniref:hypothetical protein n=1 Tax=Nocardiopsis sp. NPDC006938 TaxID=3364337 RepID=UPI00368A3239